MATPSARGSSTRRCGRRRGGIGGRGWRQAWIEPAGIDPRDQCLRLGITLPNHAAECRLDMGTRAAEAVVKVQVPEGSVHIVLREAEGCHAEHGAKLTQLERKRHCPAGVVDGSRRPEAGLLWSRIGTLIRHV